MARHRQIAAQPATMTTMMMGNSHNLSTNSYSTCTHAFRNFVVSIVIIWIIHYTEGATHTDTRRLILRNHVQYELSFAWKLGALFNACCAAQCCFELKMCCVCEHIDGAATYFWYNSRNQQQIINSSIHFFRKKNPLPTIAHVFFFFFFAIHSYFFSCTQ